MEKKMNLDQAGVALDPESEADYAPKKLTFAQNAALTVKVLAGFGLLGMALWGVEIWTSAK